MVHDTLFISASVAMRKSAKAGTLTMRQATTVASASSSSGTVNCSDGSSVKLRYVSGPRGRLRRARPAVRVCFYF